jgi:hypothetical protein
MPLAAKSQVAPESTPATTEGTEPAYKYNIFAGYAYTGLNQVNGSRYGLQGGALSLGRDWGKIFTLVANGAYYKPPLGSDATNPNPGVPTVYQALAGPQFHASLYGKTSAFVHVLIGVEHTGGESMNPDTSFAGGFGGGLDYKLSPRFAIRAYGDRIGASFSLIDNVGINGAPAPGYSPHRTWNPNAGIGVVYSF